MFGGLEFEGLGYNYGFQVADLGAREFGFRGWGAWGVWFRGFGFGRGDFEGWRGAPYCVCCREGAVSKLQVLFIY